MKPKISLLLPTRKRAQWLERFYESAMRTADKPEEVEVVCYIDEDDSDYDHIELDRLVKVKGPRIVLSQMWNKCWEAASGEYYGHMGDDIVFQSKHWDTYIKHAIDKHSGKIAFAWGNDHNPDSQRNVFGTHGFVHKNWTDITGRFVPPYFVSDYNDTWFNDVAQMVNCAEYVDAIHTEHMHYSMGKSAIDSTTQDRLDRHQQDKPEEIYNSLKCRQEREREAELLRKFKNEVGDLSS